MNNCAGAVIDVEVVAVDSAVADDVALVAAVAQADDCNSN